MFTDRYDLAAEWINGSDFTLAFTGAGISVESGIPPFRGADGLWAKYDPTVLELSYFYSHPLESWRVIKQLFYEFMGKAEPNDAHYRLADMEKKGWLHAVVTQNIDNLHQMAGNTRVYEFHGHTRDLRCVDCGRIVSIDEFDFDPMPPTCEYCTGLLKPNFIFFGEQIPPNAYESSFDSAHKAQVVLVIGTTGEVMPASMVPADAKENGARIIEINPEPSLFTDRITDIFLQGAATTVMNRLYAELMESGK